MRLDRDSIAIQSAKEAPLPVPSVRTNPHQRASVPTAQDPPQRFASDLCSYRSGTTAIRSTVSLKDGHPRIQQGNRAEMKFKALIELFAAAGMLYSGIVGIAQQVVNRRARKRRQPDPTDED
jgi:hypothetical protein